MKMKSHLREGALASLILCVMGVYAQQPSVLLRDGTVALEPNVADFLEEEISAQSTYDGAFYRIVQFDHVLLDSEKSRLVAAGIELLEYIPHYAYVTKIDLSADRSLLEQVGARSVLTSSSGMKLNKNLIERPFPSHARAGDGVRIIAQTYRDIDAVEVLEYLKVAGLDVESTGPASTIVRGVISESDIMRVAALPFISYVELEAEPGQPEALDGRSLHRSNTIDRQYAGGLAYDGTGVSIVINDDGFVGPHIDFTGRVDQSDVLGDMTGDHGDMTAGIAGGAGNLNPLIPGMAPGSFLWIRQYNSSLPDVLDLHQNEGVMVFSSSYSNGCNAGYTAVTQQVDDQIFDNPTMIQSFSAGNSNNSDCGYGAGNQWGNITGGHKIGKNVLAAANLRFNEVIETSSSRGPASDGRLKPDISAHGTGQLSTDPNNVYAPGGGTSAACPGVSGVFAQLVHAHRDLNAGQDAESALIRGCMLNSAYDLGNEGPDFIFGWGRLNAYGAYKILENGWYEDGSVSQGMTNSHSITVPAGTEEMRVMVVWTDPAASTSAAKALVNDLDMTVIDPSSVTTLPLVLDPTPNPSALNTPATNGVDTLNNVEQVVIKDPVAGTYTVSIAGSEVPMGPQGYFIVYQFAQGVELTYPVGGEGLVPGENVRILWDAVSDTGSFELEYTIDSGANWLPIATVPGDERFYQSWNIPNTISGDVLVRVVRGSDSDISDQELSIVEEPENLSVIRVCPGEIRLHWDSVPGATSYTVHRLGAMYMDSIATAVGNNFYDLSVVDITESFWWSVTAHGPNGLRSRRALAKQYDGGGLLNCALDDELSAVQVISPNGIFFECLGYDSLVTMQVQNLGLNTQVNFPVGYRVNGGAMVIETYTDSLFPATSATYTFSQPISLLPSSNYSLEVWTDLAADAFAPNDTAKADFVITQTTSTFPIYEDFESFSNCGDDNDCELTECPLGSTWVNVQNGTDDDIDWRVDNNGTPSTSTGPNFDYDPGTTNGKYVFTEASGGCTGQEAHLVSQCLDLSVSASPRLEFSYHMRGGDMGSLHVDVHDGTTWMNDIVPAVSGSQGTQWQQQVVDLSAYMGSTIVLRIRGVTGPDWQSDIALDGINIADDGTISVEEVVRNDLFSMFPNPTSGLLSILFTEENASDRSMVVYDAQGKVVMERLIPAGMERYDWDMTGMQSGLFTVMINVGERVITERLVLQR